MTTLPLTTRRLIELCVFLITITAYEAMADAIPYGPYSAELVKVVAADTVRLAVATWPGQVKRVDIKIRFVEIPDKNAKASCEQALAKKALTFTKMFMATGKIEVSKVEADTKIGQVIGDIFVNGRDLRAALIEDGNALPYSGGDKKPWCE